MNDAPSASVQPHDEDVPGEADLAGSQTGRPAVQSGHERISKPRRRRIRRSVVGLLVALSCLLVLLSTTEVWAHRTLLNTPTFVGTVGPVFKNPAVTSAVAVRATDQLFTELNLQARLKDALPPKASFAAAPVVNATKGSAASPDRAGRPGRGPDGDSPNHKKTRSTTPPEKISQVKGHK
jgi:hypothetical protein